MGATNRREFPERGGPLLRHLDDLDEKVLACLTRDARATYAQIGDEVGLSAPAVKRRVDRLLDDGGVIRGGFTAIVDPHAMQWTTEAYVQVYCRGNISPDELKASWEPIPEVVSAATISGQADASFGFAPAMCATSSRHSSASGPPVRWTGPNRSSCSVN